METVSDGSMVLGDSIAEEETYSFADEAQYKEVYALSGPELKMWSEGVSQQDIAKKLGITQAQVSRRITANIKKIRERFGVEDDTAE
jgi:DNA-directed RNA polymerase specialized sigma subunit